MSKKLTPDHIRHLQTVVWRSEESGLLPLDRLRAALLHGVRVATSDHEIFGLKAGSSINTVVRQFSGMGYLVQKNHDRFFIINPEFVPTEEQIDAGMAPFRQSVKNAQQKRKRREHPRTSPEKKQQSSPPPVVPPVVQPGNGAHPLDLGETVVVSGLLLAEGGTVEMLLKGGGKTVVAVVVGMVEQL